MKQATRSFLTASEAGRLLDPPLTPAGIRAAANRGALPVAARTRGGQRLFSMSDIERFRAQRQTREAKDGQR
jgi:DNA-binding transcriptional MerR regulator